MQTKIDAVSQKVASHFNGTHSCDYEVVIVGGGMMGATLAYALGQLNIKTAVLESVKLSLDEGAAQQPSFDDRTIALSYGSRLLLEQMGLWDLIEPHAQPINQIRISEQKRLGLMRISAREEGLSALGYVVENRVMGHILYEAIGVNGDHPLVDFIAPAKVSDVSVGNACATIDFSLANESQTQQITSQLLIAADGTNSFVRERLGITTCVTDYGLSAVICNIHVQKPHHGMAFERFTSHGPLAFLPLQDFEGKPRVSVVLTVKHEEVAYWQNLSDAEFLSQLQSQFGYRLGRLEHVGRRSVYPVSLTEADQIFIKRALVMGNAAQTMNPVAGQGFNLALRDATSLIELFCQPEVNGQRIEDWGDHVFTQAYGASREQDRTHTITFTDALVKLFSNRFMPLSHARSAALLLSDLCEPARQGVVRRGLGFTAKQRIKGFAHALKRASLEQRGVK